MTTKTERGHLSPHCLSLFVHALPLHMRNIVIDWNHPHVHTRRLAGRLSAPPCLC